MNSRCRLVRRPASLEAVPAAEWKRSADRHLAHEIAWAFAEAGETQHDEELLAYCAPALSACNPQLFARLMPSIARTKLVRDVAVVENVDGSITVNANGLITDRVVQVLAAFPDATRKILRVHGTRTPELDAIMSHFGSSCCTAEGAASHDSH